MEELDFNTVKEKLREHLDISRQNWLFGAGISFNSNIPLMYPLTDRVRKLVKDSNLSKNIEILDALCVDLDENCHIEHYLSHLGDLIALSDRSRLKLCKVGDCQFTKDELITLYKFIILSIGDTIRFGYKAAGDIVGTALNPIIEVAHHIEFVKALFKNRSNLMSRSKLTFFTTNYDTLLEDALSLLHYNVVDGFSGGSLGFWNPTTEFDNSNKNPNSCFLYKLHGSIDWQNDSSFGLIRVRYGTKYLADMSDILIYPQATKYVETQKDPFSYLFNGFRKSLNHTQDNVLITCGYSFGDDHINSEIESALSMSDNKTTLIVFIKENPENDVVINKILDRWIDNSNFSDRIYVAGNDGLYYSSLSPYKPDDNQKLLWWTFEGLTKFIKTNDHV